MRAGRGPLLLLLLAGVACASLGRPLPVREIQGEQERVRAWLERLRAEGEARQALRADGSLWLQSPDGSGSIREVILAERPARLRLESLNVLGQTQSLLVVNGSRFSWFDGRAVEHGATSSELLRERLGLDLSPEEAVAALLVDPAVQLADGFPVYGQGEDRIVETRSHRLRFDGRGELIACEALDERGAVRWRAAYDRWRDAEGGRYPFGVKLFFPGTSLQAEIELREVVLNTSLDPGLFELPVRDE